jgi:hypothetical protein
MFGVAFVDLGIGLKARQFSPQLRSGRYSNSGASDRGLQFKMSVWGAARLLIAGMCRASEPSNRGDLARWQCLKSMQSGARLWAKIGVAKVPVFARV